MSAQNESDKQTHPAATGSVRGTVNTILADLLFDCGALVDKAEQIAIGNAACDKILALAAAPTPDAAASASDDPDHQYAVVSSNYVRPFLAGAYPTLEAAVRAQCGKPDLWHIYRRLPAAPDAAASEAGEPIYQRKHGWENDGIVIRESDMIAAREITAKGRIGYGESIRRGEDFVERVEAVALGHALARAALTTQGGAEG